MLQRMGVIRWHESALAAEMVHQFPSPLVLSNAQARPGLMQIDQHSGAFLSNGLQRSPNQFLAVAIERAEDIPVGTMRVHTHQYVGLIGNVAVNERQVALSVDTALIADGAERAGRCLQMPLGLAIDKPFGLQPVANQISYRDHLQVVADAELSEL